MISILRIVQALANGREEVTRQRCNIRKREKCNKSTDAWLSFCITFQPDNFGLTAQFFPNYSKSCVSASQLLGNTVAAIFYRLFHQPANSIKV